MVPEGGDAVAKEPEQVSKKRKFEEIEEGPQKNSDGETFFDLGKKRRVTVRKVEGDTVIDVREFYDAGGEMKPGKNGISLTRSQFEAFFVRMGNLSVPSRNINTISFTNGAHANLNTGATPTTVTFTDGDGIVYKDQILVGMDYSTGGFSSVTWDNGTAEKFVADFADSGSRRIDFYTRGSRAPSQNADFCIVVSN